MDFDLVCPYCGHEEIAVEIFDANKLYEHECASCQRVYNVTVDYDPVYICSKKQDTSKEETK